LRALAVRAHAAGVDVTYASLESTHGHDGFLADAELLTPIVRAHVEERRRAEGEGRK